MKWIDPLAATTEIEVEATETAATVPVGNNTSSRSVASGSWVGFGSCEGEVGSQHHWAQEDLRINSDATFRKKTTRRLIQTRKAKQQATRILCRACLVFLN